MKLITSCNIKNKLRLFTFVFLILLASVRCIFFQNLSTIPDEKKIGKEKRIYAYPKALQLNKLQNERIKQTIKIQGHKKKEQLFHIRNIYIFNKSISQKDEFIPKFINFFHWTTEPHIIRREILYLNKEKKITNLTLLRESERNLRSLNVFKSASIYYTAATENSSDNVKSNEKDIKNINLYIETNDRLTNTASLNYSISGGNTDFLFALGENNLFGRLISLTGSFNQINNLSRFSEYIGWQRIANTKWKISTSFSQDYYLQDIVHKSYHLKLSRPFYSRRTPWMYYLNYKYKNGSVVPFEFGKEKKIRNKNTEQTAYSSVYEENSKSIYGGLSRSYGIFHKWIYSLECGNNSEEYHFRDKVPSFYEQTYLPRQEDYIYIQPKIKYEFLSYIKTKNFRRFIYDEDVSLGFQSALSLRQSFPFPEEKDYFSRPKLTLSYSKFFQKKYLMQSSSSVSNSYYHQNGKWLNAIYRSSLKLFWGFSSIGYFANRIYAAYGQKLFADSISKYFENMGEEIRGLPERKYRGNSKLLFNSEFRSRPIRIWYAALGFVIFNDWGDVWYTENSLKLKSTVGLGLRLSWVEFDNYIIRVDFGIPVKGEKALWASTLSIGMYQVF